MEKFVALPNLLVFTFGSPERNGPGGSGFRDLVESQKIAGLPFKITGVVCPYRFGSVRKIAEENDIRFLHFPGPYDATNYNYIIRKYVGYGAPVALIGWLKKMSGHNPKTTFNIHPARLAYGGKGMYGLNIHRAVLDDFKKGLIKDTAVTMHFVTEDYDKGPVFFEYPVEILHDDTPEILQARVKNFEHCFQWMLTTLVCHNQFSWDGKDPKSLIIPDGYHIYPVGK